MFSSKSFIVSDLTVRSWIHCELIFCRWCEVGVPHYSLPCDTVSNGDHCYFGRQEWEDVAMYALDSVNFCEVSLFMLSLSTPYLIPVMWSHMSKATPRFCHSCFLSQFMLTPGSRAHGCGVGWSPGQNILLLKNVLLMKGFRREVSSCQGLGLGLGLGVEMTRKGQHERVLRTVRLLWILIEPRLRCWFHDWIQLSKLLEL